MKKINQILNYTFKDENLLKTALTHSSYASDNKVMSYERLEYLGDALLNMVVAKFLYDNFFVEAGDLSKYRAKLVNAEVLGDLVQDLGLDKFVLTGKSVKKVSHNIYADIYESVLAAIYLDGGDYAQFVHDTLLVSVDNVKQLIEMYVDHKTKLQETLQSLHISHEYKVKSQVGSGVDAQFEVELIVGGKIVSSFTASSIKLAEQNCARLALQILSKNA